MTQSPASHREPSRSGALSSVAPVADDSPDRFSGLRIREVEAFPIWIGHRNQLLVKVTADDGTFGWGESGLSGREQAVIGAIAHYRDLLVGMDPFRIGHIWQKLYRSQYFEGGRVLTAAISAIDIALYDLKGKALGVPAYELLGGRVRDQVPSLATTNAQTTDIAIEQAQSFVAEGFDVVRFGRVNPLHRPDEAEALFEPRRSLAETANCLVRARSVLGSAVTIGVDYHHRLSVAEAISFCQRMPRGTLDFLEEPIRDESPEAYDALRRCVDVPFAIGEEFSSKWQALPFVERGLLQYMRLDVCNIGGLTESLKVAGWCEAYYIDVFPHNPLGPVCTAASIHFAAVVPNFAWLEYNRSTFRPASPIERDLFPMAPELNGTMFDIGTVPGIGIQVDEKLLRDERFKSWNPPMLRRLDGSHTNW